MVVTDDALLAGRDLAELGRAVERGGASAIQLRLKQVCPRELAAAARRLLGAVTIPVVVNDRPDVALAVGAAGVHLGSEDLPVALARRIAPPGFVIGASVGSADEAAAAAGADYWGIGPWRVTATKGDAGDALGPEGFARLARVSGGRPVSRSAGWCPTMCPRCWSPAAPAWRWRPGSCPAMTLRGPPGNTPPPAGSATAYRRTRAIARRCSS